MSGIVLAVSPELRTRMEKHPEVDWSKVVNESLLAKLYELGEKDLPVPKIQTPSNSDTCLW